MLISTWFHLVWSLNHTQERTPTFMQKSPCKVICKACEGAVSHNSQNIAIKLHQIMNLIMLFKRGFQKCVWMMHRVSRKELSWNTERNWTRLLRAAWAWGSEEMGILCSGMVVGNCAWCEYTLMAYIFNFQMCSLFRKGPLSLSLKCH